MFETISVVFQAILVGFGGVRIMLTLFCLMQYLRGELAISSDDLMREG